MSRLPGPYRPFPEMTELERRQYLDCRLWYSKHLEICLVCETSFDLIPYEGGFICPSCLAALESVEPLDDGWGQ